MIWWVWLLIGYFFVTGSYVFYRSLKDYFNGLGKFPVGWRGHCLMVGFCFLLSYGSGWLVVWTKPQS